MKDLDFFQKGVIKFGMILLLGGLCMVGIMSRSVAGEINSAQVAKWKIFGRVIDEQGEPIIGAAILEQGTTNGCVTDTLGNYKLTVKAGAVLRVSFVGYVTREIVLKKEGMRNVRLRVDNEELDEVVVVGYGSVARKNFTGSVSVINTAESPLALLPNTNSMDALRGTVTGITVSQQQGAGQAPSLQVRGQKSIGGSTSNPLIVMDGVIFMGSLRDIDPNIIESMSVLKDATSLAAYGSQAANGVVMITTKQGKLGKPVLNFNASWTLSEMANRPEVLSPENYIKKINATQHLAEDADPSAWMSGFELENYKNGKTTDWLDYVSRVGLMQSYSASVSGATEKLNYFLSASHVDQEGVIIGDDYKREALSLRLQSDVASWLQVGTQMGYTFNDYSGPTTYNLVQALRLTPYGRVTRPNGELEKYPRELGGGLTNPLWLVNSGTVDDHDTYATTLIKGHVLVKCPWLEGLTYRVNAAYSWENVERDYFEHEGYFVAEGTSEDRYSASALSGFLSKANGYSARTKNTYWVMDHIVNFNRQFGKHFIDATYVYTRDSKRYDYRKMTGSDFSDQGNTVLGADGLVYAKTQKITNIDKTKHNNIGYLGRISYNYNDTYHLSVSVRRDGSSVFGKNSKWGVFPAVGVAWTVSNERFMKRVSFIDYLKLKGSWGKNGNQSLDPYMTLSQIKLGQQGGIGYPFGNESTISWGQRYDKLGNADLGWETTEAFNYGFDLGLLGSRIYLEFDGYFSKTTDQIFDRLLPVMNNGLTSMKATMGQIDNWGIEATLTTQNVRTKDWNWSTAVTFYLNRNKLKDLYGDGKDDISNSLFIGKSLGAIYGYKSIGIVQEEDIEYIEANNAAPGDVKFANLDGSEDGTITADDRTILGYNKENFRMSLSNTLKYKNLELYFLFAGVFGGNGYGLSQNTYAYQTATGTVWDNNLNHGWWTPENRSNKYPRVDYADSRFTPLQSYGFVRLQDLSLSYTFHQDWLSRLQITGLKVFFAAKNVFTITNWVGGDPEIKQTLGGSYGYPLAAMYSFGVNLTF